MKRLFAGLASVAIIVVGIVCWAVKTPMTMCLTFDDDQAAHATVAGPTLEKYGWRGVFNIVTGRLEHPRALGKMTWRQAEELLVRGHEIFPHSYFPDPESVTFSHYNLRSLAEAGNIDEVERQVAGSKKMIEDRLGVSPPVFCLPFNAMNNDVEDIILKNGMIPMNCNRRNFPTDPSRKPMSINEYVRSEWRNGSAHIDIMMHGIIRSEGGWEPFEDAEHFDRFCKELKRCEESGIVKIVGYAVSHSKNRWVDKLHYKVRFYVFKGLAIIGLI